MIIGNKCFLGRLSPLSPAPVSIRETMAQNATEKDAGSEFTELLNLHEHLMRELQQLRDELGAPETKRMVSRLHASTGSIPEGLGSITATIEEAIRAIKLSESQLRMEMTQTHPDIQIDGIDNMPAVLSRFIAERAVHEGFQYKVIHDENRGWIVRWKEYWDGNVRGSGQFYERPYAWLDD